MKSRHKILIITAIFLGSWAQTSYAQLEIPTQPTIYNSSQTQYIQADNMDNPLRAWAYAAIRNPGGDVKDPNSTIINVQWINNEIQTHADAKAQTLKIINNFINYALAWLSTVALLYLMYHGFIILTAASDDSKYKEGMKGIKYAAIALIWIGFSWIFISVIFRVVQAFAAWQVPK